MPQIHHRPFDEQRHWYALTHLNPQQIEKQLQVENSLSPLQQDAYYQYFIPFRFLRHVPDEPQSRQEEQAKYDPLTDANALRDDLHNYVFVRATARGVEALLHKKWNLDSRLRLRHLRDTLGREVIVPDREMQLLIDLLGKCRIKFFIGQPLAEAVVNDTVIIEHGQFAGTEAKVTEVVHTSEGICLTLGLSFFGGVKSLQLPGFHEGDVTFVQGKQVDDFISHRLVSVIEQRLIEVLTHRLASDTPLSTTRQDIATLNDLYHYSYLSISQTDVAQCFRAQMLLCAYLRRDSLGTRLHKSDVLQTLGSATEAATLPQAYLMLSLFVVTRRPQWRAAVKAFVAQSPDCPSGFRSLLSVAKRLRCR